VELIKQLLELSINLQKRNLELISNTNKLTEKMDKFLDLFERASKHISEVETTEERLGKLSTRLDSLLEQNKAIAKGLILLEKYIRGKTEFKPSLEAKPLSEYGNI